MKSNSSIMNPPDCLIMSYPMNRFSIPLKYTRTTITRRLPPLPQHPWEKNLFFWRVRALGMGTVPISAFSEVTPLFTSPERASMDAPVPETAPADAYGSLMLYPVYSWVAPTGAASFEVDIFSEDPEQNHAAQPLATLHAAFSELYDPSPRYGNHPFYWRVRALDDKGSSSAIGRLFPTSRPLPLKHSYSYLWRQHQPWRRPYLLWSGGSGIQLAPLSRFSNHQSFPKRRYQPNDGTTL